MAKNMIKTKILRLLSICVLVLLGMLAYSGETSSEAKKIDSRTNDKPGWGWAFEYDDADLITKITGPSGRSTKMRYSFDKAKRLRKFVRTAADGTAVINEFNEQGQLSHITDGAGRIAYGYDNLGRLKRVQRKGSSAISYTYDILDRIKSLQVGDFYRIEYTHDFLGRLESMKTPAGVIHYEYLTGQGKVIRTLPNGVKTIIENAPDGKLRQITHGLARKPNDNRYEILSEYTYQYRPDGLIKSIRESSEVGQFVKSYEYDTVGRLVRSMGPQGQQTYEYDLVGNRVKTVSSGKTSQINTFDWAGRITSFNGNPSEHDTSGNLTSIDDGEKTQRYRYNQDNQLAEIPDAHVSYQYDGNGQLIARTKGGNKTTFIPNPLSGYWQPLVIEDKAGHRTFVVWDGATPLVMIRDGKPEYLLHDHLGSVRLGVNEQGKVIHRFDYGPFGKIEGSANAEHFAPRFAGLFWEPDGDVYLTRARAYSPKLGRFLQIDPLQRVPSGSQKGFSGYSCCGGDLVNYVDLDGAECQSVVERDNVIDQVIAAAFKETAQKIPTKGELKNTHAAHVRNAWKKVEAWRSEQEPYPNKYLGANKIPSPDEFRTAENRLYAFQFVMTGKNASLAGLNLLDRKRGKSAADMMTNYMIPAWKKIHTFGEKFSIGPQVFLRGNWRNQGKWRSQTPNTIKHQHLGVKAGLSLIGAEEAEKLFVQGLGNRYSKPLPDFPMNRIDKPKQQYRKRQDVVLSDIHKPYWFGGGDDDDPPPGEAVGVIVHQ